MSCHPYQRKTLHFILVIIMSWTVLPKNTHKVTPILWGDFIWKWCLHRCDAVKMGSLGQSPHSAQLSSRHKDNVGASLNTDTHWDPGRESPCENRGGDGGLAAISHEKPWSPRASKRHHGIFWKHSLLGPWFQTSSLKNHEKITSCYWSSKFLYIMAAGGN